MTFVRPTVQCNETYNGVCVLCLYSRSDLLHQKDYAIRCLCDDKFNATLELLELFAKDEIFGGVSFVSRSSFFIFPSLYTWSFLENCGKRWRRFILFFSL